MIPRHESKTIKQIHEGKYAAEVEVTLHYSGTDWDPTLTLADVQRLERVQLALRRGDIKAAAKEARVFELLPLAGE
jgi:hypothetical protein